MNANQSKNQLMKNVLNSGQGKVKWWHGALFLLAVNGLTRLLQSPKSISEDYKNKEQAPWAPPGWVFAPAWTINNISQVSGNIRLLNEKNYPHRKTLLAIQVLMWADYVSFEKISTGLAKPSPILSLALTKAFTGLSIASLLLAQKGGDRKIVMSFIPLSVWGLYATSVAAYQALYNRDEYFGTPALLSSENKSQGKDV